MEIKQHLGVFWAFGALIDEFYYCRPLTNIDGTHLYGKYKAKLLVAVAYVTNNEVYPLYFSIVEKVTNNNWNWFLDLLCWYVIGDHIKLCIISDRNATFKNSMAWIFPKPIEYHWYCSQHFVSNFNIMLKNVALEKYVT